MQPLFSDSILYGLAARSEKRKPLARILRRRERDLVARDRLRRGAAGPQPHQQDRAAGNHFLRFTNAAARSKSAPSQRGLVYV